MTKFNSSQISKTFCLAPMSWAEPAYRYPDGGRDEDGESPPWPSTVRTSPALETVPWPLVCTFKDGTLPLRHDQQAPPLKEVD